MEDLDDFDIEDSLNFNDDFDDFGDSVDFQSPSKRQLEEESDDCRTPQSSLSDSQLSVPADELKLNKSLQFEDDFELSQELNENHSTLSSLSSLPINNNLKLEEEAKQEQDEQEHEQDEEIITTESVVSPKKKREREDSQSFMRNNGEVNWGFKSDFLGKIASDIKRRKGKTEKGNVRKKKRILINPKAVRKVQYVNFIDLLKKEYEEQKKEIETHQCEGISPEEEKRLRHKHYAMVKRSLFTLKNQEKKIAKKKEELEIKKFNAKQHPLELNEIFMKKYMEVRRNMASGRSEFHEQVFKGNMRRLKNITNLTLEEFSQQ